MSLAIALTAAAAAAVVLLVERRAARLRLLDRPNERSSHVVPRPRGGGLGILAGVAVGLMALAATGLEVSPELATVLAAALLVALTGLWDDLVQLSPSVRLAAQTTGAAIVVAGCGHLGVLPLPGPTRFVIDGVNGRVTEPQPEALGAALADLHGDRTRAARLGEAGYELARRITWSAAIERLVEGL